MTDVEKSEISFIISDFRCFFGKSFCRNLRAIAWRKFEPKIVPVEKNDKYEVCIHSKIFVGRFASDEDK